MALTPEEIKDLKVQLYKQVAHLPAKQKEAAEQQIDSMSIESLEALLKESQQKSSNKEGPEKTIFRRIVDKEIPSTIADENSGALAVLEIRPVSEGHTLVIPKKAAKTPKDLPAEAFTLAKKLAKRIISNLKAKSAQIQTETKFGEAIINIIPIYDSPLDLNSPRSQPNPEALEKIVKKLQPAKKPTVVKIKQPIQKSEVLKLPRRIP